MAKEYAQDEIKEQYCTRFIIGMFYQTNEPRMMITSVETFGFRNDKKKIN